MASSTVQPFCGVAHGCLRRRSEGGGSDPVSRAVTGMRTVSGRSIRRELCGWASRSRLQPSVLRSLSFSCGDRPMRAAPVALVAVLALGCAGRADGSPLLPRFAGVALQSKADIDAVRWRYRHGYFWGGRRSDDIDRNATNALASRSNLDIQTTPWRRHRRDYGGNDRTGASALRDETDASGATLTRPTTSGAVWPDRRRRRGWVDPPSAR
jgi:hypothetical protein